MWSPFIVTGEHWGTLYTPAAEGLDVLPRVEEAIVWVNDFVQRLASMT